MIGVGLHLYDWLSEGLAEAGHGQRLEGVLLAILGVMTLVGFYAGGLAKRIKLPSLIGYMVLGVLLGPSLLRLLPHDVGEHFGFITQIALGFVAFTIGAELSLVSLRRLGGGIIAIIFAESLVAFFLVTLAVYAVTRSWPMALIFGAVAPASAPAGTVAVIQEYKAKGSLTQALYAVVGFDDGLAIVIFGFAAALAKSLLVANLTGGMEGMMIPHAMVEPLKEIVLSVAVGGVLGVLFCQAVRNLQQSREMLVMVFGFVLLGVGLAARFHLSLILTNMTIGFVLVNTRREALVHKVTAPLPEIMPLLFILFFCLAGSHLEVDKLASLGLVGVVYILARSAGLIGGSRIGAMLGHVEEKIKTWIGLGILSQAGVAIGLSLIIRQDFLHLGKRYASEIQSALAAPGANPLALDPLLIGASVITTITATCIVFELVGPILTKMALKKAGEIPADA